MIVEDICKLDRQRFEEICRRNRHYAYLGENEGLCQILGGDVSMYIDTKDTSVAPHMIINGYWESWITLAVAREVPKLSSTPVRCLDIGANQGYFSLLLAALGCDVVAIEMQRDLCDLIERSIAVNGFDMQVVHCAMSDEPNQRRRVIGVPGDPRNRGSVRLDRLESEGAQLYAEVSSTRTVDAFFEARGAIDFIKVDAEGFEDKIWAGAQKLLDSPKPPVWLMEFTPHMYEDPHDFLLRIEQRYPLREVDTDGSIKVVYRQDVLSRNSFTMLWLQEIPR